MSGDQLISEDVFDPTVLSSLFTQLLELLWDPTSNLTAALLLYGIIAILVIILIVAVLMLGLSAFQDEEDDECGESASQEPQTRAPKVVREEIDLRSRFVTLGITLAVGSVIWLAAGFSTSQNPVCVGCHTSEPHSLLEASGVVDPHASTACVGCHEPSGSLGHYVFNLPSRVTHFVDGVLQPALHPNYGRPTQSGCLSCHRTDVRGVAVNEQRGLRMSHVEPLESAVECLDCHRYRDGMVAGHNAGMNPCLRCHDSKQASSECSTCHDRQAAAAARARSTQFAAAQVEQVRCGGCHDERRECDPCHGVRMPHDQLFMSHAHARAATVDFWFGNGQTCQGSCHTDTRRPCRRCHTELLGKGHGPTFAVPHELASSEVCDRCHQAWAITPQRDFCDDVCHSEAARRYSPR